jgi:hypothetical protein
VYARGEADTNLILRDLSFNSGFSTAEMVEVYAMALLRDLDFDVYNVPNPIAASPKISAGGFQRQGRGQQRPQSGEPHTH